MFLQPKNTKHKKIRKGRFKKKIKLSNKVRVFPYGAAGLVAASSGFITARQIEAGRRSITGKTNRTGKLWVSIFPNFPVLKKPSESRMGKGTGSVSHWASKVRIGSVLFQISGVSNEVAANALKSAKKKIPIKTKIVVEKNMHLEEGDYKNLRERSAYNLEERRTEKMGQKNHLI